MRRYFDVSLVTEAVTIPFMPFGLWKTLGEQADRMSRTTALNPLNWLILVITGTLAACVSRASGWLQLWLMVLVSLLVLVFLASFAYLLFHDRDALRSERYSLSKMAMQKGLIGDDLFGLIEPDIEPAKQLPEMIDDVREGGK